MIRRVLFLLLAGFGLALAVGLVIAEQMRPPPTVPDVDILTHNGRCHIGKPGEGG
ncbi:MAG TPA: hypothetical protein VMX15_06055 [Candidatus Heimdallarchaeota archaeon]|nr:hypothetical protein [Candidatus Heimdallarchaeota archaeon]